MDTRAPQNLKIRWKLQYFGSFCDTSATQYTDPGDIKPVSIDMAYYCMPNLVQIGLESWLMLPFLQRLHVAYGF